VAAAQRRLPRTVMPANAAMFDMDQTLVHIYPIRLGSGRAMRVAVTNAKAQLTELVRRAKRGKRSF